MLSYLFLFFCFLFLLRNLRSHFHFFSLSFTLLHLTTLLFSIPFHLLIHLRCEKVTNWSVIKKKNSTGKTEKTRKKEGNVRWKKWVGKVAKTSEDERESRQKSRDLSAEKRWENAKKTAKKRKKRKFEEEMRKNIRRKKYLNALSKSHRRRQTEKMHWFTTFDVKKQGRIHGTRCA